MNETTERELSVFEKHQLLIARKALTYSDAAAAILGGPTRAEAREIIERITSKAPSDAANGGGLRDGAIVGAICNQHHRDALGSEAPRPLERSALAGELLQRRAKGGDRLLEPPRPALPLTHRFERFAEVDLYRSARSRSFSCIRLHTAANTSRLRRR